MKNKRLHHHYVISRNGQPALALLATYTQKWLALKGLKLETEKIGLKDKTKLIKQN